MIKHAIIGDVHGHIIPLLTILEKLEITLSNNGVWNNPNNYKVIFTGDLNDYTENEKGLRNSYLCLRFARALQEQGIAITLHSNHQDKLYRYMNGNKVQSTNGLDNTIKELELLHINDFIAVKDWLYVNPLWYKFEVRNRPYVVAHAYFDDMMFSASKIRDSFTNKKTYEWLKANCIYGLTTKEGRVKWYEDSEFNRITKFNLICGHYHLHKVDRDKNFFIIDDEEWLTCYIPEEECIIKEPKIC